MSDLANTVAAWTNLDRIQELLWDDLAGSIVSVGGYYEIDDEKGPAQPREALEEVQRQTIRAVLEAIAEPSDKMVQAAADIWPDLDDSTDRLIYGGVYGAMIAALWEELTEADSPTEPPAEPGSHR